MKNAERFKAIFETQINREGAAELLAWLETTDFFTAPASTKHHGAYPGGLVAHSLNVYDRLLINPYAVGHGQESRAIVALLHDLCKVEYYHPITKRKKNEQGQWEDVPGWEVKERLPMGHGEKSVYLIMQHMKLTDDEALAIRWHMGAYDDAFRGGSYALNNAMKKTPLVLALHTADMMATQDEQRREGL